MHLIIYISEYTGSDDDIDTDLVEITRLSKSNNLEAEITGLLFYQNHHFLQVIESKQSTLENLMAVLAEDKRHRNIERILDEKISTRSFSDWNMDSFNLSDDEHLDTAEIKKITEKFKKNIMLDSGGTSMLVHFYKSMLAKC